MTLTLVHDRLRAAFWRWGWLLPVVLPLATLAGRGLFNVLSSVYALWGLLSLWGTPNVSARSERPVALLYGALLATWLLSLPGAVDPERGLRLWLLVFAQSLVVLLLPLALRNSARAAEQCFKALALTASLVLGALYLMLFYQQSGMSGEPFDPLTQMREDSLPFLLPFLLGGLWWHGGRRRGVWMVLAVLAMLAYAALAEGRAALLGLVVGLAVFGWAVLNWRWYLILLAALLALAVGIAINSGPFRKAEMDAAHPLDAFTAGRTMIWRQALAQPPARPWRGVGMGNVVHVTGVLHFELGGLTHQVKHLHNVLLDAWYETGLLGVAALLALIGTVFGRLAGRWRHLSDLDRQRAGVLLAAALALLAAGSLSFSYTGRQFACYFFICLGGLSYYGRLATGPAAACTDPDKR